LLNYTRAVELLDEYGAAAAWTRHCMAVSKLATSFAELLSERYDVDVEFVQAAALLHDIGRCRDHHPIRHGVEGYGLMVELGYEREAHVCASHTLFGLKSDEAVSFGLPEQDFMPRDIEESIIPFADSLLEFDRPTTVEKRYASLRQRYKDNTFFFSRLGRAEEAARSLLGRFKSELSISFEDVARDVFQQ
jgi:uncharacterized protein